MGKFTKTAPVIVSGNGTTLNTGALLTEATRYIKHMKGEIISSGQQGGSDHVIVYRFPQRGGTDSIVVALKKMKTWTASLNVSQVTRK